MQNSNGAVATELGTHPYDYYWRPGQELRPAPPRLHFDPMWTKSRKELQEQWMNFHDVPVETPRTRLLADHFWQGDELMDAVVARFRQMGMGEGRTMLQQALDDGIDAVQNAPDELVALFESLDNPPDWYDAELWERGRRLWNDSSYAAKMGMLFGDTFGTFVGDEVAYATGATGRFVNDTLRRQLETSAWFQKMTVRGALERFSQPFKDTILVRLMHSQVRAGLRRSWGDEQFAHHGNPISNTMMMGAAMTFGLIPPLMDHRYGRRRTVADIDAAVMYWAYIAHVFGVAEELIPKNAADGIETMDYIVAYAGGASEWTDLMMNAAFGSLDKGISGKITKAAITPVLGVAAFYGGDDLVREMMRATPLRDGPLQPWKTLTGIAVRANVRWRRITDRVPVLRDRERPNGEILWGSQIAIAQAMAKFKGLRGVSYTHHDATAATPAGAPVPAAPRIGMPSAG